MSYGNGRGGSDRRGEINKNTPMVAGPRLPLPFEEGKKRQLTQEKWNVLVDAIYPSAMSTASVLLALDYCAARGLDPFKKPVHVVPVYSKSHKRMVETVWPGINSIQTDAARTKEWAGMDPPAWGPLITKKFTGRIKKWENGYENYEDVSVEVTFPESCSVTVYRVVGGARCAFTIPVYWEEAYATQGGTKIPNEMWQKRPRGQLHKNSMAASLRAAFPEAGEITAEEMEGQTVEGGGIVIQGDAEEVLPGQSTQESRAPVDAPQEPPPRPWADMLWPYEQPNGAGLVDLLSVEEWTGTFKARIEKIVGAPSLDEAARNKLLLDLQDRHKLIFADIRADGGKDAVGRVEAMLEAARNGQAMPPAVEAKASEPPVEPPSTLTFTGLDGKKHTVKASPKGSIEAIWGAAWKRSVGAAETLEDLRKFSADNEADLATVRQHFPDVASLCEEAIKARLEELNNDFPGDRPSRREMAGAK